LCRQHGPDALRPLERRGKQVWAALFHRAREVDFVLSGEWQRETLGAGAPGRWAGASDGSLRALQFDFKGALHCSSGCVHKYL
jgi:hypothetical protein